jgi:hypothetical protein
VPFLLAGEASGVGCNVHCTDNLLEHTGEHTDNAASSSDLNQAALMVPIDFVKNKWFL